MASIDDVARYSGVSTATVSRALRGLPNVSEETRRAVREAAAALGYVPSASAAALASGRHRAIAAIAPTFKRWYNDSVIEGADAICRDNGYEVVLVNLGGQDGRSGRRLSAGALHKRTDAAIALGIDFSDVELAELQSLDIPTIIVGGEYGGITQIGIDDAKVAAAATEHLIALGHRRIAQIGGAPERGVVDSVALGRRSGWIAALSAAGLRHDDSMFREGNFRIDPAKRAALELLTSRNAPTAIFAASDEMAFGVIIACWQLGLRIPEDVSVIGVDDHDDAGAFELTTFRQSPIEYGRLAAQMLLDRVERGVQRTGDVIHDAPFVDRGSTGPPPH